MSRGLGWTDPIIDTKNIKSKVADVICNTKADRSCITPSTNSDDLQIETIPNFYINHNRNNAQISITKNNQNVSPVEVNLPNVTHIALDVRNGIAKE